MENINLDIMPIDGAKMMEQLAAGNMVVARSSNDFLYIVEFDDAYHMFSHTIGSQSGGQRQFPKDEKNTAVIKRVADLSIAVYVVEFDKELDLYGVMYTAEEAILTMFPGEDRDNDAMVDFMDFSTLEE